MVTLPLRLRWLAALLLALTPLHALTSELVVSVDRDRIALGESLTLTLRYQGQAMGDPDFSSLERDFEILSSQRQSHLSLGAGADTARTEWRLALMPRRGGTLLIPSFHFRGEVSDALQLEVSDRPATTGGPQPLFVETQLDTANAVVGEQVLLIFKVHSAQPLVSLSTEEPEVDGARVARVHEAQYQSILDGIPYSVVELRYALFPERPGQLSIPALRFRGEIADASDPFRALGRSPFASAARPVVASSTALTLEVSPAPSHIASNHWLPSKGVSLAQRWSREVDEWVVGEPVTRSVIISAQGLQGAQLPPLSMDGGEDFRLYPDQPRIEDSTSATGVQGTRIESLAMVPLRPGVLTIPEIRLPWWDTVSGEPRETVLDAVTVNVVAAPESALTPGAAPLGGEPTTELQPGILPWLWASAIANLVLGAVAVSFALLWWRQRNPPAAVAEFTPAGNTPLSEREAFAWLRRCPADQPAELRRRILHWGRLNWPRSRLKTLDDMVMLCGDRELADYLSRLDTLLYGSRPTPASQSHGGPEDKAAIIALLATHRQSITDSGGQQTLPPLYPTS